MIMHGGAVAQWIERRFPKPCVGGSSPLSPIHPHGFPYYPPKSTPQAQKGPSASYGQANREKDFFVEILPKPYVGEGYFY